METDLSREECFELARRWRTEGDERALERLVLGHLPLARKLAADVRPLRWLGTDDMEAEAVAILFEQARRYEPERGVPFRAYITIQIRGRLWTKVRGPLRGPGWRDRQHYDDLTVSDHEAGELAAPDEPTASQAILDLLARTDQVGELARAVVEGHNIHAATRRILGELATRKATEDLRKALKEAFSACI